MLREWWKDDENKEYVEWLRGQLYGESAGAGDLGLVRTVGVPALLLQEKIGQLLQRFLHRRNRVLSRRFALALPRHFRANDRATICRNRNASPDKRGRAANESRL